MSYLGHRPRIYAENAIDYTNNGLGFLSDAQTCKVTEKLNGGLELEMQYPISGNNYESIKINAIIYSPINPYDAWQPFRIYNISRPQNGIVKVNAEHKVYELSGYPCLPNDSYIETAGSASQCMAYLQSEVARTATALGNPAYTFQTDILTSVRWSIESPTDIWSVMADVARWYEGEWKYDGTVCRLCAKRGQDRHVKVQYGSNLSTITQDEVDTSYTHIMPYWTDGTTTVYLTNLYMIAPYTEARMQTRVQILDLSNEFDSEPTEQELEDAADAWAAENPPKGIEKNLKVTFVSRGQTIEYASLGDIDHVELGDTIDVSSNPLNVNSTLRCITLVYDVLRGVYVNAELGEVKSSLATAKVVTQEQSYPTVWVSTAEPTEGYKSGDYWIKIDNNVTRKAQALGRFTGGNWLLLCEFGGGSGTGKWLDDDHTSAAHNDWDNNTSQGKYDSIDGYKNTATGTGSISNDVLTNGGNTVTGEHNTLTRCTDTFVSGRFNDVHQAEQSIVSGNGNTYYQIKYSVAIGYSSIAQYVWNSILAGHIYGGTYNGQDAPAGRISGCFICGDSFVFAPNATFSKSIYTGSGHNMTGVQDYNAVFGKNHTAGRLAASLISGEGHTASGDWHAIFGEGHSVAGEYKTVCGKCGVTVNGDRLLFVVGNGTSSARQNAFTVDDSGNVNAAGTITPGGADYAEYFEWLDGNPENEDRRGMLVTLDGDKLIPAHGSEFIGVISANPSVIGNNAEMHWHGKYKTDVFGCIMKDEAGKPIISDDYKKQKYVPRSERTEWGLVGLVGRLVIVDDGSCKIGGYVSARRGIGTSCYTPTNARVLKRIDETHVEVLVR